MNTFAAIDQLIFGPTLEFAAATRYSVDDAVTRLRSVTLPRWMFFPRFQCGLYGNVDPDRVTIGWHNPWMRDGFQPWFVGRFTQDSAGLRLSGTIGFPAWKKAIAYTSIPIWIALVLLLVNSADAPAWVVALAPVLFAFVLSINSVLRRGDAQKIANALDAALA
jgi:hypothetical protein